MIKILSKKINYLALLALISLSSGALATPYDNTCNESLKAARELPYTPTPPPEHITTWIEWIHYDFARQNNPRPDDMLSGAFDILKMDTQQEDGAERDILDYITWQDLHLLSGPTSDVTARLADKIDRTSTILGKATLYHTLVNPTSCIYELKNTQNIIKELIENKDIYESLYNGLDTIKDNQNILLTFWDKYNRSKHEMGQSLIKVPSLCKRLQLTPCKDLISFLNRQTSLIETRHYFASVAQLAYGVSQAAGALCLPIYALLKLTRHDEQANRLYNFINTKLGVTNFIGLISLYGVSSWLLNKATNNRYTEGLYNTVAGITNLEGSADFWQHSYGALLQLRYTQEKLISVAKTIKALKNICEILEKQSIVAIPEVDILRKVLYELPSQNSELAQLFDLLESNTFAGRKQHFCWRGIIFFSYRKNSSCL